MIKIEENTAKVVLGVNPIDVNTANISKDIDVKTILLFSEEDKSKMVLVSFNHSKSVEIVLKKLREIKKDLKKLESENQKVKE